MSPNEPMFNSSTINDATSAGRCERRSTSSALRRIALSIAVAALSAGCLEDVKITDPVDEDSGVMPGGDDEPFDSDAGVDDGPEDPTDDTPVVQDDGDAGTAGADDDTDDGAPSPPTPSVEGGTDAGGPVSTGDDVVDTLHNLNVDTEEGPRLDGNGQPLPESYTPLRPRRTLRQHDELFVAGLGIDDELDQVNLLKFTRTNADGTGMMNKLPEQPLPTAWRNSEVNAAAAGDVDGDGFDEVVLFWWDDVDSELRMQLLDDRASDFAASEVVDLGAATPTSLSVVTADFEGKGVDGVAVGVVDGAAGFVQVTVLGGNAEEGFRMFDGQQLTYEVDDTADVSVVMRSGYLDRDAPEELVVVVNETLGGGRNGSFGAGSSRYYVYDDQPGGLAELASDVVSARVDNASVDGLLSTVALGDVDGDGLDEIVLAGIADSFPVECEPVEAMHVVLDDAVSNFAVLGAARSAVPVSPGCEVSGNGGWTNAVWVDTLNIDQDEPKEIHVNGKVFDDFVNNAPWTPMVVEDVPLEIPGNQLFKGSANNDRPQVTWENSSISVADVTDDGYDDLIVYTPLSERFGDEEVTTHHLVVWGFNPATGLWGKEYTQALAGYPQTRGSITGGPILLLPLNVDDDSTVLQFTGTHRVVFTEPIVHAALAAPPCWDDGSQVTEDCRTSWGQGSAVGADAAISHEITAKVHKGYNGQVSIPFVGDVGVEMEETVGLSLAVEASLGYELSRTVTYQTGAMEDTVIATVIPYDQYIYRVLAHSRYSDLVGEEIVVSLPRRPRTMQIERQYFNDSLAGGVGRIDNSVFSHVIGDPTTYPTESDARSRSSLRVGPVEVGASNGNTDVEISESIVAGFTTSISVSYEATVKATAGVAMAGFSVGQETSVSLGVTAGSTTTFAGSVGDILPESFTLDKAYGYGMFVYTASSGDQDRRFEVINYWVE